MPEPTTTAAAGITLAAASVTVPAITAFGVPLGLRTDLLIAGFAGSLVAIVLLNSVPSTGDTWREMLRTTVKRMFVCFASALTAGYLTPLAMLIAHMPEALLLGCAFGVGGGAQQVLMAVIKRLSPPPEAPPPAQPGQGVSP